VVLGKGRAVSVTISDLAGVPVKGAEVSTTETHGLRAPFALSNASGLAVLESVDTSPQTLFVSHDSFLSQRVPLTPDAKEITVRFSRGAALVGVVTDATGKPLNEVDVRVESQPIRSAQGGPDGRFRIEAVPAGRHAVSVNVGKGTIHPRLVEFPESGEVSANFQVASSATTLALTVPRGLYYLLVAGEVPLPSRSAELRPLYSLSLTFGRGKGKSVEVEHLPSGPFTLLLFRKSVDGKGMIARQLLTILPDPVQTVVVPMPSSFSPLATDPDSDSDPDY